MFYVIYYCLSFQFIFGQVKKNTWLLEAITRNAAVTERITAQISFDHFPWEYFQT